MINFASEGIGTHSDNVKQITNKLGVECAGMRTEGSNTTYIHDKYARFVGCNNINIKRQFGAARIHFTK